MAPSAPWMHPRPPRASRLHSHVHGTRLTQTGLPSVPWTLIPFGATPTLLPSARRSKPSRNWRRPSARRSRGCIRKPHALDAITFGAWCAARTKSRFVADFMCAVTRLVLGLEPDEVSASGLCVLLGPGRRFLDLDRHPRRRAGQLDPRRRANDLVEARGGAAGPRACSARRCWVSRKPRAACALHMRAGSPRRGSSCSPFRRPRRTPLPSSRGCRPSGWSFSPACRWARTRRSSRSTTSGSGARRG